MPGLDRTGPFGEGKMTGFRRGFCGASAESSSAKNDSSGARTAGIPKGMGHGRCGIGTRGSGQESGQGRGSGQGAGFGRHGRLAGGPAWYAVGYAEQGESSLTAGAHHALEVRKELLESELARVKSILEKSEKAETGTANGTAEP